MTDKKEMTPVDDHEMSKSLCITCKNYLFEPGDTYGTWCVFYKDIYQAIRDKKIVTQQNSDSIDRSAQYDQYGVVYCEGYQPK